MDAGVPQCSNCGDAADVVVFWPKLLLNTNQFFLPQ